MSAAESRPAMFRCEVKAPCAFVCRHPDCEVRRRDAAQPCARCGERIGVGKAVVEYGDVDFAGTWHHEACFGSPF